ncbi:MAG TPA: hypothetical protein VLC06_05360 [Polyangia bacterium]|jgi:hypothetical protein|nr:hypothetical protein [Polyangia bacterium]
MSIPMAITRPLRSRLVGLVQGLVLTLALGAAGCTSYPSAPAEPAYDTDVLPIFQAHCTRCHDNNLDGGAPHTVFLPAANGGPMTAIGPSLSQFGPCNPTCSIPGAAAYAPLIQTNVHLTTSLRMPLPPAPALDDWELNVIDAWVGEGQTPICSKSANPDPTLLCP